MLSDNQIDDLCCEWLYVAPGRTYEEHRPFARAIESAACAERDARIAELERQMDVMAKNTEAQAHASVMREIELTEKVEKLTRELEEARKDAERYRHLCNFGGQRTELCFDGGHYFGKADFDAAIDEAIKEQT